MNQIYTFSTCRKLAVKGEEDEGVTALRLPSPNKTLHFHFIFCPSISYLPSMQTDKVSDHYPIQIEVVLPQQSGFSTTTVAVGVTVAAGAAIIGVRAFQRRRAPTTN